jgi:predicted dithiol-disulfide oxidoreductase (DUF899 family)
MATNRPAIRFPGEPPEYRAARDSLVEAERDLRRQTALNVFVRRNGRIHHFYNTELLYAATEPGQNGRHVDLIWPLWNLFDLTPEGRGTDWYPALSYPT